MLALGKRDREIENMIFINSRTVTNIENVNLYKCFKGSSQNLDALAALVPYIYA